jgi:hypothetical protein
MFMRLPRAGLIRTLAAMGARAVIAHARASFPTWALLALPHVGNRASPGIVEGVERTCVREVSQFEI